MWLKRNLAGYAFLLPSLLFLLPFTLWPAANVIYRSFLLHDMAHPQPRFAGLQNYAAVFANPVFWKVVRNTLLYALGTVPVSIVLALLLAIAVNRRLRFTGLYRTALFYPTVLPTIGAAAIWLFVYVPNLGLADRFLALFGVNSHRWLGDPHLVLPALALIAVWKQTGYFMVFYLAGLQTLPPEVFEAADLDGAGGLRKLISLTVPLLLSTTVFVSTVALINAFQTVDQLYLLTQGGPDNASNLLLFLIYQEGFNNFNFGRASALTAIMLAFLLGVSLLNYRYLDRLAHYES